ncbi:MAG TPA: serine hydrolase [Bryobacteraceae bacterium]|nr:serine hydrolase [Bryobacteraceae bacterium]
MRDVFVLTLMIAVAQAQDPGLSKEQLIARAKSLELATPYVPPPGDPVVHEAGAYAKVVCSAVFITGFLAEFAAENLGYVVAPYASRQRVSRPVVNYRSKSVSVTLRGGVTRVARHMKDQGCVALPVGRSSPHFKPTRVKSTLRNTASRPWPMGDKVPPPEAEAGLNLAKLQQALDDAFQPRAMTAAFVVTWKGRIVAERYAEGVTGNTALESWSMGKSLSATLIGVLIQQGAYSLWQPAPIPEWQNPDDPRRAIRIGDLLRMSSGLRIRSMNDPDYDPKGGYPDHLYLYTGEETCSATPPPVLCNGLRIRSDVIEIPIRC